MQHTGRPISAAAQQAVVSTGCMKIEPTLADLFGDPITHSMMEADHVDYSDFFALLRRTRHFIALSQGTFSGSPLAARHALAYRAQ